MSASASRRAGADLPRVEVGTRAALRAWLQANHARSGAVWIVRIKKSVGGSVVWDDIVEEALCFGWIDSLPRKLDATRTMLRLSPRKPGSRWSAKNKAHVAALESRGLLAEAGRAAVARAKADGSWAALDSVSALAEPDDLVRALAAVDRARQHWDAFPPSIRRGILEWIAAARRPATRTARITQTARLAGDNVRANQWRPKADGRSG